MLLYNKLGFYNANWPASLTLQLISLTFAETVNLLTLTYEKIKMPFIR